MFGTTLRLTNMNCISVITHNRMKLQYTHVTAKTAEEIYKPSNFIFVICLEERRVETSRIFGSAHGSLLIS